MLVRSSPERGQVNHAFLCLNAAGGLTEPICGHVNSLLSGIEMLDFAGRYGDWYGVDDLGHAYCRGHANFGEATGELSFPYANDRIRPSPTANTVIKGFHFSTGASCGAKWRELMCYPNNV